MLPFDEARLGALCVHMRNRLRAVPTDLHCKGDQKRAGSV